MARPITPATILATALREEFRLVKASRKYKGGSAVLLDTEVRALVSLAEWQLFNTASAFFFGKYKEYEKPPEEDQHALVIRAFQAALWQAVILSIAHGHDCKQLKAGHWLVCGVEHLRELAGEKHAVTSLVFRCGKILEGLAVVPASSSYHVASLLRQLFYSLGCLGAALGVSEHELVQKMQHEQSRKGSSQRKSKRDYVEGAAQDVHAVCKRLFLGHHRPVVKFLGRNLPGTLGHLCIRLGENGVDLIRSLSQTVFLDGREAMCYLAWVQLPLATAPVDMISSLAQDPALQDVLLCEPEICTEDAGEEEWALHSEELLRTEECHRVYINGHCDIATCAKVEDLRAEQANSGTYALFFDGPRNTYWVHRDRHETGGKDELSLVCYFAMCVEGFRSTKEMHDLGLHISSPSVTFRRCRSRLEGVVEVVTHKHSTRLKGWSVTGRTCCILSPEQQLTTPNT